MIILEVNHSFLDNRMLILHIYEKWNWPLHDSIRHDFFSQLQNLRGERVNERRLKCLTIDLQRAAVSVPRDAVEKINSSPFGPFPRKIARSRGNSRVAVLRRPKRQLEELRFYAWRWHAVLSTLNRFVTHRRKFKTRRRKRKSEAAASFVTFACAPYPGRGSIFQARQAHRWKIIDKLQS